MVGNKELRVRGHYMKEICLIIDTISYMVEASLWLQVFLKLFQRKYKKRTYYIAAFLIMFFFFMAKQFVVFTVNGDAFERVFNTLYLPCYIIMVLFIARKLFQCSVPERLIAVSILFLFSMVTDILALVFGMLFFNCSMEVIHNFGLANSLCTIIGRIFMILFFMIIFSGDRIHFFDKVVKTKDVIIALVPNCMITLVYFILMHNLYVVNNDYSIVYFLVMINVVCFLFSFWYLFRIARERRSVIYESNARKQMVDYEIALCEEIEQQERTYKKLCDDLIAHYVVLDVRYKEKNYIAMEHYLTEIIHKLQENKDSMPIYLLGNHKIEILLREYKKVAEMKDIHFTTHIGIQDFQMREEDIYAVLSTMIKNAIAVTEKERIQNRYVKVRIDYSTDGYYILCQNSQVKQPMVRDDCYIVSHYESENCGYGIRNIKEVAEKYNGNLKFSFQQGCFGIYAYIRPSGKVY